MQIRKGNPVDCPKCGQQSSGLFKIQGQPGYVCSGCLMDHATQQGPNTVVSVDGVHQFDPTDNTALGPSGQSGKMN